MQDAYLRAWRFRDSLSAVPSIRPWLYRVVVNSCYSKLRREIPHRDRRAGDEPLAHVPAPGADPEAQAAQGEVAETVLAALQQLPLSLRVPVVLRYYADLSERDIALAIGRRPGTVKSRLHEARRRLAADPALSALAGAGDAPRPRRPAHDHARRRPPRLALRPRRRGLRGPRHGRRRHPGAGQPARGRRPPTGTRDAERRGRGRPRRRATAPAGSATAEAASRAPRWWPSPAGTVCSRSPPASWSCWRWPARSGRWCAAGAPDPHGRACSPRPRLTAPAPRRARRRPRPAAPPAGCAAPQATPPRPLRGRTRRRRPAPATRDHAQTAPTLPSGAVGQSAKIEQTGSLRLTVGRGKLEPDDDAVDAPGRRLRRLRGQLADAVGRAAALGSITLQVPVDSFAARAEQAQALGKTSDLTDQGHRRHRPVRRPAGAHHRAGGQPPAVPDHPGQGHDGRRRPGRAGAARHHSVPDRAAAGPAAGPRRARRRTRR